MRGATAHVTLKAAEPPDLPLGAPPAH
jgi:hypothetical protein